MEHPYLKPLPPRKFESTVGEVGRAAKRHAHVERAVHTIDRLIFSELPELISDPPGHLDADKFGARILRIDSALQAEGLPRRAMVVAWRRLCAFNDQGNTDGLWALPAITPYEQLPTQSLLRNQCWQRHASLVHLIHSKVVRAIESGDPGVMDERPVALALALFFGAVHSGLCEASIMDAFAKAIMEKKRLFPRPDAPRVWIYLKLEDPPLTNTYHLVDGNPERVLVARRQLDPLTISLIRRCWDGKGDYLATEFDRNTLVRWINKGLRRIDPEIPSLPSLKRFGRAALSVIEQHTALPHVYVEVACGRIPTCDLPDSAWYPLSGYQYVDPLGERPDLIGEPDGAESPVVSSQRVSKATRDAIFTAIQTIVGTAENMTNKNQGRAFAIDRLRALDTEHYPLAAKLIVAWCLEHLELRNNAVSSVSRYLRAVGPGLIDAMSGADVYDADDLDDAYRSVIDAKENEQTKHYAAERLEDLHDVGRAHFGFPALYEPLTADYRANRHVRAAFIPEHVYKAALKEIAQLPSRDRDYKRALKVVLILAYRTGMRRNEILHLQLGDIERSEDRTIFVRANSLGRLKTSAARRNIPTTALLLASEAKIFDAYCRSRQVGRPSSTDLLFCIAGKPKQPLDGHQVTNDVKRILWQAGVSGVLHDFRHTALSRLQLVAEREWILVRRFSAYSEKQAMAIYREVFGHPKSAATRYWALAAFAGHSSPMTTFASYLHFSSMLLYEALQRSTLTYSRDFLSAVTGIGRTKLGKIAASAGCDRDALPLSVLHRAVTAKHSKVFDRLRKLDVNKSISIEDDEVDRAGPSPLTVHAGLQTFERGYSIPSIAYEFGMTKDHVRACVRNAQILAAEKTRKLRPRLVNPERATSRRPTISPTMPSHRILAVDAIDIINKLRDTYLANKGEIEWAACYWLTHTSTTEPYAWFLRRKDLKRFVAVFRGVISDRRWHIEVVTPRNRSGEQAVRAWRLRKGLTVVARHSSRPHDSPVARLHLRHPHEPTLVNQLMTAMNRSKTETHRWIARKYSAHTLQFVLHMLAIMIFTEEELIAGLAACRDAGTGWK